MDASSFKPFQEFQRQCAGVQGLGDVEDLQTLNILQLGNGSLTNRLRAEGSEAFLDPASTWKGLLQNVELGDFVWRTGEGPYPDRSAIHVSYGHSWRLACALFLHRPLHHQFVSRAVRL